MDNDTPVVQTESFVKTMGKTAALGAASTAGALLGIVFVGFVTRNVSFNRNAAPAVTSTES